MIDAHGTLRLPYCFDNLGDAREGLIRFARDGRWGYMNLEGQVVVEPRFTWVENFHEGRAFVQVLGHALDYDGRCASRELRLDHYSLTTQYFGAKTIQNGPKAVRKSPVHAP